MPQTLVLMIPRLCTAVRFYRRHSLHQYLASRIAVTWRCKSKTANYVGEERRIACREESDVCVLLMLMLIYNPFNYHVLRFAFIRRYTFNLADCLSITAYFILLNKNIGRFLMIEKTFIYLFIYFYIIQNTF